MSVSGNYKVTLVTEKFGLPLKRYGVMKLVEDGEQLKGTMFPLFYWLNSPFKGGKAEGDKFSFEVHFATPCQQYSMTVEGAVSGDEVSGVVHSPMGDYNLNGHRI